MYIDGVLNSSGAIGTWTESTLWVGSYSLANNNANALFDELVILSRAASADEIRAIYESNAPVFAESSTSFFKSYGPTPVEINEEGLWVEGPTVGAIFGIYGASATKSWGGVSLSEGDVLLGRSPAYMLWDDSEVKLKIGNVSNEHINFDGSTISFRNGATTMGSLDGTTWVLGNASAPNLVMNASSITFRVDDSPDGNRGYLSGSEWVIGDSGSNNTQITSAGIYLRNSSTVLTSLVGSTLTLGQVANSNSRIQITSGAISIINRNGSGVDTTAISLLANGAASFTGTVTAAAGTIGGWTLSVSSLVSGSAGTTVGLDSGGTNPAIYAGSATPGSAPFRVTNAGVLTATSGTVGGWTLGSSALSATNISLISGAANTAHLVAGTGATAGGINSANAGADIVFWAGGTHADRATSAFRVTAAGALVATSATITGAITASSGSITGALTLGASGGIYQGSGTFASPTTGLKIWNDGGTGRIAGYNTGALQWYAGTDGKLYAGGGNVTLDSGGISILSGTLNPSVFKFRTASSNVIGSLTSYTSLTYSYLDILSEGKTVTDPGAQIQLRAKDNSGNTAAIGIVRNGSINFIALNASRIEMEGAATLLNLATSPSLPSVISVNMYLRNNKFILQYNDSGTVRYKYLDLTGTGVTWVHTTTAP
jgi:hypothetical protein